jgi:DNA-binding GntR family transcriptional regulator
VTSGTTLFDATPSFDVARTQGLRDEVVVAIERAVLVGNVTPGQRLVESDIARQMGISKAPVREALRELERLGLVVSYPRRGTFVAEITPAVASEAFSLRAVVESYAARLAVRHVTDVDLARMETLLHDADAVEADRDDRVIRRAERDLAFHDEIYRLSGHRQLQDVWGNLRTRILVLLVATGILRDPVLADRGPRPYSRGHAPILNALRERDADAAEVSIVEHLAMGERLLVERLAGNLTALRVEAEARERRPGPVGLPGHLFATDTVAENGASRSDCAD